MSGIQISRLFYGAFVEQRWTIGLAEGQLLDTSSWKQTSKLLTPLRGGDFLADPFFVPGLGGRVFLCEWKQGKTGKGVIARVALGDDDKIAELTTLLDLPEYHLSYPYLLQYNGALYCCPENCHSRALTLYRLSDDARDVISSHTVMEGFACVDPTIFRAGDRWWLTCTSASNHQSNSHLHAFYATTPFGPWQPHLGNPIKIDAAGARPAGPVFVVNGEMIRPAQDCSVRYGGGTRLFRIDTLTDSTFAETELCSLHPPLGKHGQHGAHTVGALDKKIIFDAYTERLSPFAWYYRLLERTRQTARRR